MLYRSGSPILALPYTAQGRVPGKRFCTFGSEDGTYKVATSPNDPIIGISDPDYDIEDGQTGTVIHVGSAPVVMGGTVPYGAKVTTDATGRAVVAGAGQVVGGCSIECSAVKWDIALILVSMEMSNA